MKKSNNVLVILMATLISMSACVSNKKFNAMNAKHEEDLKAENIKATQFSTQLNVYETDKIKLQGDVSICQQTLKLKEEQIEDLKNQILDFKNQREKQLIQVGDLTVLSKSASDNIKETLQQLEKKDKYIQLLQMAKSKADSINLALAINLKGVLQDGIDDKDVEIKVDKTVVFINLSDKMLYQSGSANLTPKANEILSKIAKIIESRPDLEVMVEGYTDNKPISNSCITDNWDLSVKRATSVVRTLQKNYGVNPNRLIAAGRGEYNTMAPNDTEANRAINRRTRIIILPKLNQFYDLLDPNTVPK